MVAAGVLAGCSGKSFEAGAPTWAPGHRWEWTASQSETIRIEGEAPSFYEFDEQDDHHRNWTSRLEIFNTTTVSQDELALYVGGWFRQDESRPRRGAERDEPARVIPGSWSTAVFTRKDLDPVEPDFADFAAGVIEVHDGAEDPVDAGYHWDWRVFPPRSGLRFPLHNEQSWVGDTGGYASDEDFGQIAYRVGRQETRTVPAGEFDAIRISAGVDLRNVERLRTFIELYLESEGASVSELDLRVTDTRHYWYSSQVEYIIEDEHRTQFDLSAKGVEGGGRAFDFRLSGQELTSRRLLKFELSEGVERPLAFLSQLGEYNPPPITPLADYVPEIVVDTDGLNAAASDAEPAVQFRLHVFNTTAGEKRLRNESDPFPRVAQGTPFDGARLEANWTFERQTPLGFTRIGGVISSPTVTLPASQLGGPGLKQVTVRLIDRENHLEVSSDKVLFEVYWAKNVTVRATEANVTAGFVHVDFPVEFGATSLEVGMTFSDASSHPFGRVRVFDTDSNRVNPESSSNDRFMARSLSEHAPGLWQARYVDGVVPLHGSDYTFALHVGYGPMLELVSAVSPT